MYRPGASPSSDRNCLERIGLGDPTRELNRRAVVLAEEALPEHLEEGWTALGEDAYRTNLHEQARIPGTTKSAVRGMPVTRDGRVGGVSGPVRHRVTGPVIESKSDMG